MVEDKSASCQPPPQVKWVSTPTCACILGVANLYRLIRVAEYPGAASHDGQSKGLRIVVEDFYQAAMPLFGIQRQRLVCVVSGFDHLVEPEIGFRSREMPHHQKV